MAMFSKKSLTPAAASPQPAVSGAMGQLRAALANPYISAGGAAGLFLVMLTGLVLVIGDPKAGAPVIRLPLAQAVVAAAPPGWREALTIDGSGPGIVEEIFELSETPITDAEPMGEAVITLPGAPAVRRVQALPPAPIAGLFNPGPNGPLPVIAANGRTPAQAYARPFQSNGKPKVSLIVGGLGLNSRATREAIETLPGEITLSFVPYAEGLQGWIDLAREHGHEVLLETPMEPVDYPDNDPGPYTLLASSGPAETSRRLEWLMSRATGYFGLTNYLGSRFLSSDPAMATFTTVLKSRGLAFVDDGQAAGRGLGIPRASAGRIIDEQLSSEAIDAQLLALEAQALQNGQALGSGFAYPLTISQVAQWTQAVEARGYQLAPASALTKR
ncbi:MAG: divergent polysaccharide deacetylase family protein [Phenylobacterium sp.]|uniref:divergent polysaccharide deacetylase family protein n=1 Tax=Phenylobacterium sp. TaxID=1871053 RepID=UPI0025CDBFA0|nr:divergent polysaccharide deacetylase family protein [Phenylobacterium sp.]MCG9914938.1 divergent polysaccharide deacetylase family protein [Phenylobacterium sp.]